MKLKNKKIAIVGGGPGGLTLARLLQLKSADVKVYERDFDRNARVQGSPLDMHENSGLAAIRKAGLLDEFKKKYRPGADKTLIVNDQAEVFFSDHDNNSNEAFGDEHFRPEIDRGPLCDMLLDSLQPETVVWDSHFISMDAHGDGWLLHFKNGSSVYADVVVASDGANSKIRPYLTDVKPFYSGVTMLEGNVVNSKEATPNMDALVKGGKMMAFGNGKNILLGQKGDGNLGFYASFKTDENWSKTNGLDYSDNESMRKWFTETYPEWAEIWRELFENATPPFIPRPIYCMPLDQTLESRPNLTMLGDAAHVMPPFAGEGANMAMLDALELSEHLTSDTYVNLKDAISAYESTMRKRASQAAKDSLENGELMHSPDALQNMLAFFSGQ